MSAEQALADLRAARRALAEAKAKETAEPTALRSRMVEVADINVIKRIAAARAAGVACGDLYEKDRLTARGVQRGKL